MNSTDEKEYFAQLKYEALYLLHSCESPIELRFAYAALLHLYCETPPALYRRVDWSTAMAENVPRSFLFAQHIIKHYRVDFLLVTINPKIDLHHRLVIECDGAHHLDQAEADAVRDEEIRKRGYDIIRFTGTDIVNDVDGVIEQLRAWTNYLHGLTEIPAEPPSCMSFLAP
jgi:very-short-patch-repair endonuclease